MQDIKIHEDRLKKIVVALLYTVILLLLFYMAYQICSYKNVSWEEISGGFPWGLATFCALLVICLLFSTIKSLITGIPYLLITDDKVHIQSTSKKAYDIYFADVERFAFREVEEPRGRWYAVVYYIYVLRIGDDDIKTDGKLNVDYIDADAWALMPRQLHALLKERLEASRR